MAGAPPPYPPPPPSSTPPVPPASGYDPRFDYRAQRRAQQDAYRAQRDQIRYQTRGLRRHSILGPILLIATGLLFLLIETGRIPQLLFWDWFARWWPLLLVAAGLVLLAEWGFDQFVQHDPEQPIYRRSIGGGVFTLLLFVALAGLITHIVRFHGNPNDWFNGMNLNSGDFDQMFGDKHESDQTLDLAFASGSSLTLSNPHGDITLAGTADDNRIHLAVHKQIFAHSDSDADSKGQRFTPQVTSSGQSTSITMPSLDGARADLVLTVPAAAFATLTANHGDIHVSSVRAPITVTANHGDIELSAITGAVTAHINNRNASISAHSITGALTITGHAEDVTLTDIAGPVSFNGDFYGDTHLEHIAGALHYHTSRTDLQFARLDGEANISPHAPLSIEQALGPVVLSTHDHDVTLNRIAGDISVTNRNGSIDLTAAPTAGGVALGAIALEDRNGSIHATLPERAAFSIQASTTDGDISTEFPLTPAENDSHKTLTGSVGSGGPLLRISTTNGDIALHKAAVAPLPSTPPAPPKLTLTPPTPPTAPRPAHPHPSPSASIP